MIVYLNGRFVPAEEACVSVFDRGFLYGDGLFETMRAYRGRLPLGPAHMERLQRGASALDLRLPAPPATLLAAALELLARNRLEDAVVRLTLSRGTGPRGYSPRGASQPTLVLSAHPASPLEAPAPAPWRLHTSSHRVRVNDPLTSAKTANKLLHVLARAEAEAAGADEALLLNTAGRVAEAAAANLFWFEGDRLLTPPVEDGALPGITRGFVLEIGRQSGWTCAETGAVPDRLRAADAVCLTLSSLGIVSVASWDGRELAAGTAPERLRKSYRQALERLISD